MPNPAPPTSTGPTAPPPYAQLGWRSLAAILDYFILTGLLWMVNMMLGVPAAETQPTGDPVQELAERNLITLQVLLPLFFMYYWLMEAGPWQATLGKHIFGLKVVNAQGGRLGYGQAALRSLLRVVSALTTPLVLGGFLPAFFDRHRRALHDWGAQTRVVPAIQGK